MNFLKRLLGGGKPTPDSLAIYVYVRLLRSGEVLKVRLQRGYDISESDEGGYFSRKLLMGRHSFDKVDATFYFSNRFALTNAEFSGGAELAQEADYLAQQARPESSP
jgi:hypothetical protein